MPSNIIEITDMRPPLLLHRYDLNGKMLFFVTAIDNKISETTNPEYAYRFFATNHAIEEMQRLNEIFDTNYALISLLSTRGMKRDGNRFHGVDTTV